MERRNLLINELYGDDTPPVRVNHIRKILGYAPRE